MFEELNERRKSVERNIAKGFGIADADLDLEKAIEDELEKGRAKKNFAVGDTFTRHGITYKCTGISSATGRPTWSKVKDSQGVKPEEEKQDCAIEWMEFTLNGGIKKKRKEFDSQDKARSFIDKISKKDSFYQITATSGLDDSKPLYKQSYANTPEGRQQAAMDVLKESGERIKKQEKQKSNKEQKKDELDLDEALKKAKKIRVYDQEIYNDAGKSSIMKEMFEAFGLDNKVKVVKSGWGPYIMKFYVDGEEKQGYNIYGRDGKIGNADFASCVCDCIIDELKKRKIKFDEDDINPWIFDLGKPKIH